MDYSITDLMKAASMMSKKYFGKKGEYTISFTKEDVVSFFLTMGHIQKSRYA